MQPQLLVYQETVLGTSYHIMVILSHYRFSLQLYVMIEGRGPPDSAHNVMLQVIFNTQDKTKDALLVVRHPISDMLVQPISDISKSIFPTDIPYPSPADIADMRYPISDIFKCTISIRYDIQYLKKCRYLPISDISENQYAVPGQNSSQFMRCNLSSKGSYPNVQRRCHSIQNVKWIICNTKLISSLLLHH